MSAFEVFVLCAVAAWLAVLSIAVILCIRQIALIGLRISQGAQFSFGADGPPIGQSISPAVLEHLPAAADDPQYVFVLSATCHPCRTFADELRLRANGVAHRAVALVSGVGEPADVIAELIPNDVTVIRDPEASTLSADLGVQSVPFLVEIRDGRVAAKTYVSGFDDVERLMQRDLSQARDEEVLHAG